MGAFQQALAQLPAQQQQQQLHELQARFAALHARLAAAELGCRFQAIQQRLSTAEAALCSQAVAGGQPAAAAAAAAGAAAAAAEARRRAVLAAALADGASPIQARLAQELYDKGVSDFRFVRVPGDYYEQPLEFRRACLDAPSIHHLCKSIIMENTKAHPSVCGWDDPHNSKYYVVIVQYTARLNADKLKGAIHRLNGGRVGKQFFNMRLCPGDVSDSLSGYQHNAVTPVGIATPLPIVLSHEVAALSPPCFWIGAGEVDLKVGMPVQDFVAAYQPMVMDCTYEKSAADMEGANCLGE